MRIKFSITFLLILLVLTAVGIRVWQKTRALDHFEVDVAGRLVKQLPKNTKIKILRNPDYHRHDENVVQLEKLPAPIHGDYSSSGCVAEFWAPGVNGNEEKLFSIIIDAEMFDRCRTITLRLDKPEPVLKPDPDFWASLRWSPNLTQRMRYLDLPWLDQAKNELAPMPVLPNLVVRRETPDEILETLPIRHYDCQFDGLHAEFAEESPPKLVHGDKLHFSVTYESGGLFDPVVTEFVLQYNEQRHKLW